MNDVHNSAQLATDDEGFLYNPGVRTAMTAFALPDDTAALEAAAAVRTAAHAIERLRAQGAGGRGLSTGALDVLVRLSNAAEEGLTVGDLAQALQVTSRNITGLVDTLERDTLARRVPDPHDRRSVRVTITSGGLDWLDAFRQPTRRAMATVFRGFSPDDLVRLRHLCLRLAENQQQVERYMNGTAGGAVTAPQPPTA